MTQNTMFAERLRAVVTGSNPHAGKAGKPGKHRVRQDELHGPKMAAPAVADGPVKGAEFAARLRAALAEAS